MNLNIIPVEYEGLNCADGLMISLVEWLNRDYSLIFCEAWNFEFKPENEEYPNTIGDRLSVHDVVCTELLYSTCGVGKKSVYNDHISLEEFMTVLKEELSQQRPVVIVHDLFWCPWSKDFFLRNHELTHSTFVIGFNETGLICMDYALRQPSAVLPYEYFERSVSMYITIDITPLSSIQSFTYKEIMNRMISATVSYDTFNTIRKFGSYVKESFDPSKELERYGIDNFNANPLNWQIERISASRKLFAYTLKELSKKYDLQNLLLLANRLEQTIPKWSSIMSMIIKSCISSSSKSLEKISNKIFELADFEESIFKCLVEVSENPHADISVHGMASFLTNNQSMVSNQTHYLDLSDICNSRAFDNIRDCIYIPDFSDEGALILKDSIICEGILQLNDMSFKLVDVLKDVQDHILCKGQVVNLPAGSFKKIGILGCSTDGNYSGQIKVTYADGSSEAIMLELSDCYPRGAGFEQEIFWIGQCAKDRINYTNRFACQLYGQFFDLKYPMQALSITLPDCPKMHIFAMSLVY